MADSNLTVEFRARDQLSGELKRLESGVIRFVGAISAALTAVSAIGFPIVEAAKFQRQLLEAAKTTDFSRDQVSALKDGLVDLSKQIDVSAEDLGKIATMGGQLGIATGGNVRALVSFTEEVARAVTALDVSAELASTALGKLINIFNLKPEQFRQAISSLNQVSNTSNATADQLFDVARRIGDVGGSLDFPEAIALSGAMIDLGLTSETAGTTISKVFANMKSQAEKFAAFMSSEGNTVTTQSWIDLVGKDGLAALEAYLDKLNELPVAVAAAAKVELTGGGRIFEAVTKLQTQRERAARLTAQASQLEAQLAEQRAAATTQADAQGILATQQRITALKELAVRANVITRLEKEARDGYTSGTSAIKEQQTVLGGLSRRWLVFTNRVKALGIAVGDVVLPPLTAFLQSFGNSLDSDSLTSQLQEGMQDVVDGLGVLRGLLIDVTGLVTSLESTGVDWASFLRLGALLAGIGALKLLVNLSGSLGASLARAVPALGAFSRFLIGTRAAADGAARSSEALATSTARTGGLFRNAGSAISRTVDSLLGVERAQERVVHTQRRWAASTELTARRQAALLATQQSVRPALRNVVALTSEIARLEGLRNLAQEQGNRRSAAGYLGQISSLRRVREQMIGNQQRLEASTRLSERLGASIVRQQENITTGANRGSRALLGLQTSAQTVQNSVVTMGRVVRQSVVDATQVLSRGLGVRAAGETLGRQLQSGLRQGLSGRGMTQTLNEGMRKIRNFAAASALVLQGAYAGANKGGGPVRNILSGVSAATAALGSSIGSSLGGAIASNANRIAGPALLALTEKAKALGGQFFGVSEQWNKTTSNVTRGVLVVQGAFNALGKAVSFVGRLASRLVGLFFFAVIAKEMLTFVGLWDAFVGLLRDAAGLIGIAEDDLPEWMQSAGKVEKTAEAVARLNRELQGAIEQSGKFNAVIEADIAALSNLEEATRSLTFNPDSPGDSTDALSAGLDAVLTGYSQLTAISDRRRRIEGQISVLLAEQEALTKRQTTAPDRYLGANADNTFLTKKVQEDLDRTGAELEALFDRLLELNFDEKKVDGLQQALRNTLAATFDSAEAARVLSAESAGVASPLQRWAHAAAEAAEAQAKLADITDQGAPNITTGGVASAELANAEFRDKVDAAQASVRTWNLELEANRKAILAGARSQSVMTQFLDRLAASTDKLSVKKLADFARQLADSEVLAGSTFKGLVFPETTGDDIFSKGAGIAVLTELRGMYNSWAQMAGAAAEKAKNAAKSALDEVRKQAAEARAFVDKLQQALRASTDTARRQTADRATDAAARKQEVDVALQEEAAIALIERKHAATKRVLAEQEAGGIRINEQAQRANELYKKELFAIQEKYRAIREGNQDQVELEKARRGTNDEIARFNELASKVRDYQKAVEAANQVIANPQAGTGEQVAAITAREAGLRDLLALQEQLKASAEKVATTQPIGGTLIVGKDQIDAMGASVTKLSNTIGSLTAESAEEISAVWSKMQSDANKVSEGFNRQIEDLTNSFKVMAEASGQTVAQAQAQIAPLIATSEEYKRILEDIRLLSSEGVVSPGSVDVGAVRAWGAAMQEELGQALATGVTPVNLSIDDQKLTQKVRAALAAGLGESGESNQVDVSVSPGSIAGMRSAISAMEPPEIKLKGILTSLRDASGKVIPVGSVTPQSNARGGPIRSSDGKVTGKGTGTSDSILSWLSNGEFVMDSLTTSRFGSGFFSMLQKIARGGNVAHFMQNLRLPGFNQGGPVRLDSSAMAGGFEIDFNAASRGMHDVVDVNLNRAGRRATVQAGREQAQALVDLLKTYED